MKDPQIWLIFACSHCGNVQIFRPDYAQHSKIWKEGPANMMKPTGQELLDHLKASGTGEDKLAIGRQRLAINPSATADDVLERMENSGHVPEATIRKAREFIGQHS